MNVINNFLELKLYNYEDKNKAYIMTKDLKEAYVDGGKKYFNIWQQDLDWISDKIKYYGNLLTNSEND